MDEVEALLRAVHGKIQRFTYDEGHVYRVYIPGFDVQSFTAPYEFEDEVHGLIFRYILSTQDESGLLVTPRY